MRIKSLLFLPIIPFFLTGCFSSSSKEIKEYYLTETAAVGDCEYVVNTASDTKKVGSHTTENNFVVLNIKIKNITSEETYVSEDMLRYFVGSSEYKPYSAGLDYFWLGETIGSNMSKTVNVVFEIPSESTAYDYLLIKDASYFSKESIKIFMRQ